MTSSLAQRLDWQAAPRRSSTLSFPTRQHADLPTVAQLGRKSAADYGHVAITWWDESVK
jgi:hypothetical protein